MRRRLGLALVIAAAIGGLASGLAVAYAHSGKASAHGSPQVVARGDFRSVTWTTTGEATVVREPDGRLRLRLSADFTTKRAPELYVYLAKLRGRQKLYWRQVAPLKSWRGPQTYLVASDVASTAGLEVAIYCGECNQINALAPLAPVTRS